MIFLSIVIEYNQYKPTAIVPISITEYLAIEPSAYKLGVLLSQFT